MNYLDNEWELGKNISRNTFVFRGSEVSRWRKSLRVSDILLYANKSPNGNAVCACQRSYGFSVPSANFSHVAMYVGEGRICHSMPLGLDHFNGVQIDVLTSIEEEQELAILRLREFDGDNKHPAALAIANFAKTLVGAPYNYRAVLTLAGATCKNAINKGLANIGVSRLISTLNKPRDFAINSYSSASGFICTDFIFNCYDHVLTEENPFNAPSLMLAPNRLPAEFYMNGRFHTVEVNANPGDEISDDDLGQRSSVSVDSSRL